MNLDVVSFEIIFNEDLFAENSLKKEEVWFDIKFLINSSYLFEITNLSSEELYNLLIGLDDILAEKDVKIYLDDCTEVYLESTKDYLKFYNEFDKSNGIIKISTTFQNNEIVKNEILKFTTKIKNIVSSFPEDKTLNTLEDVTKFINDIKNDIQNCMENESIKQEINIIKDFLHKNPEIKNGENLSNEFKNLIDNYNKKLLNLPDFLNIIIKINTLKNEELKKEILNIITEKLSI